MSWDVSKCEKFGIFGTSPPKKLQLVLKTPQLISANLNVVNQCLIEAMKLEIKRYQLGARARY